VLVNCADAGQFVVGKYQCWSMITAAERRREDASFAALRRGWPHTFGGYGGIIGDDGPLAGDRRHKAFKVLPHSHHALPDLLGAEIQI
jgi:hypothetical protein